MLEQHGHLPAAPYPSSVLPPPPHPSRTSPPHHPYQHTPHTSYYACLTCYLCDVRISRFNIWYMYIHAYSLAHPLASPASQLTRWRSSPRSWHTPLRVRPLMEYIHLYIIYIYSTPPPTPSLSYPRLPFCLPLPHPFTLCRSFNNLAQGWC